MPFILPRTGQFSRLTSYILLCLLTALSVLVGFAVSLEIYTNFLVLLCAAAFLSLIGICAYHHLRWGLPVLVGSAFIAMVVGPRLNLTFILCGILIALWVFDLVLNRRRVSYLVNRTNIPLLLLVCVASISFLVGQFKWLPIQGAPVDAQIAGLAIFWFSVGAYFIAAHQLRDLRFFKKVISLFFLLGALYMVIEAVPSLEQVGSPFVEAGSMGSVFWTWLIALASAQVVLNPTLTRRTRTALFLLVVLTLFVALIQNTSWASGWLPPLVALAAIVALKVPRISLCLGLLVLAVTPLVFQRLFDFIMVTESYSYMTRLEAWKHVMTELVQINPLLGFGPANYYFYVEGAPILGWYVKFSSHNNYVDMLAQTGLLGLLCLLWFFVEIARLGLRLLRRLPSGFARSYVYGALGGLAGTIAAGMLADWLIPFVYNIGVNGFRSSVLAWIFLGGLVAIDQMTKDAVSRQSAGGDG